MELAGPLISVALETIRDVVIAEVKFLSGVGSQLEEVSRDLRIIHCFLKDADRSQNNYQPEMVRLRVQELQVLASQAENLLEKYVVEVSSSSRGNTRKIFKKYMIGGELSSLHQIGNEAANIRSRVSELSHMFNSMIVHNPSTPAADELQVRQTSSNQSLEHVIGIDVKTEELVSLMLDKERSPMIISLLGMGGLGKTTLARNIYNHKDVQQHFDAYAWVCLGQKFQLKTVWQNILNNLLPNEREKTMVMEQRQLKDTLYEVLNLKKCIIVLDDIWGSGDVLRELMDGLPLFETNSKILLTTRSEAVASRGYINHLDYLSDDDGWMLLQKIALPVDFEEASAHKEQREDIGRKMIQKCGGLPLAISVLGGLLKKETSLRDWRRVNTKIDTYLTSGRGIETVDDIEQILSLSYNTLPYYLKPCFLYLGCYYKDEKIDTEFLYMLWMAEGMISPEEERGNETLKDVAERYLTELASRCMVLVESNDMLSYTKFKSCHLHHDLWRFQCLSKGRKEKFLNHIDKESGEEHFDFEAPRLSIILDEVLNDVDRKVLEEKMTPKLRSLLFLSKLGTLLMLPSIQKLQLLRVLVFEGCKFKKNKLPTGIDKLIFLRFFSIKNSLVNELPSSLFHLQFLQTLDLRTQNTITLPNEFSKLEQLRHLFFLEKKSKEGGKLNLEGLNHLETLEGFESDSDSTTSLTKLTNIRRLTASINCKNSLEELSVIVHHIAAISNKLKDTSLEVSGVDFTSVEGSTLLNKIFTCESLSSLQIHGLICDKLPSYSGQVGVNLVKLDLIDTAMKDDPMELLEKLPMLVTVLLGNFSFSGVKMICRAMGFPELKYLKLCGLPNFENWEVEEKAFRKLSCLEIEKCHKLDMLPQGLRSAASLQKLETRFMPKLFNDKLSCFDLPQVTSIVFLNQE